MFHGMMKFSAIFAFKQARFVGLWYAIQALMFRIYRCSGGFSIATSFDARTIFTLKNISLIRLLTLSLSISLSFPSISVQYNRISFCTAPRPKNHSLLLSKPKWLTACMYLFVYSFFFFFRKASLVPLRQRSYIP